MYWPVLLFHPISPKMVLIFSESTCFTTSEVVEWLKRFGCDVVRLNHDDAAVKLKLIDIHNNQILVSTPDNKDVNLLDAKSVWYRRRGISNNFLQLQLERGQLDAIFPEKGQFSYVYGNVKSEVAKILEYVYIRTQELNKSVGSHFNSDLNKLVVLEYAREAGLTIPKTVVLNDREQTKEFISQAEKGVITKAISDGIYHFAQENAYYSYTEKVTLEDVEQADRPWFHSLFQTQIDKDIEIRSFYFDDTFYSMAIFSQRNAQTEVDFRKYDATKPNRTVPYQLPKETEDQLRKLFARLHLNTGSVDLILDKNGEYHFLEINPVGQFGMVSYPCNYQLEKKVATYLAYESDSQTA